MKTTAYKSILRKVTIVVSDKGDFGPTFDHPRNCGITRIKSLPNNRVGPAPKKYIVVEIWNQEMYVVDFCLKLR